MIATDHTALVSERDTKIQQSSSLEGIFKTIGVFYLFVLFFWGECLGGFFLIDKELYSRK